jgi:hypothetical protein
MRIQAMARNIHSWQFVCIALVASLVAVPATIPWQLLAQQAPEDRELEIDRRQALTQLKLIGQGMLRFENDVKTFPPPALLNEEGKPLLSWRVMLLPYMGDKYKELYSEFHLDEPWDSEHNKSLIGKMPAIYRCPRSTKADAGMTVFQVPRGPSTAFEGPNGFAIRQITDGTSKTIGIVEVDEDHAVPWTKPEDWAFDPANPAKNLGGHFSQMAFLAMACESSVHAIPTATKKEALRALFTRNGGEIDSVLGNL